MTLPEAIGEHVTALGYKLAVPVACVSARDCYQIILDSGRRIEFDAEPNIWDEPVQWHAWVAQVLGEVGL